MHQTIQRRHAIIALLLAVATPPALSEAGDETALREAIARFQKAWNARDMAAWEALVTDDVRLQETYYHTDESRQINNRPSEH